MLSLLILPRPVLAASFKYEMSFVKARRMSFAGPGRGTGGESRSGIMCNGGSRPGKARAPEAAKAATAVIVLVKYIFE